MSALALRRVNSLTHARSQAVQRWQLAGHYTGMGRPDPQHEYLSFCACSERGDWHGLINARDWLHHALPQLQALLTVECPAPRIAELLRAVPCPFELTVDALHYRNLTDVELLDPAQVPAQQLPWLATPQGRVWLTALPSARPATEALHSVPWLADLPQRLELILGVSYLSRSSHARLGRGDVLLINDSTRQCVLAGRGIGFFTFTEEGICMEKVDADSTTQAPTEPPASTDLSRLPVRVEFVLATHEIALGELAAIIAGQVIPLAAEAAQGIEVRANGKRVARGELVQLDEGLGVELLEVYRNAGDE
ncbi:type III secretion apparatus protein SpaO [Pseudomonas fluorescens HK44]|uniref:Surface presentation of antigens protein SpaO n=1 Tax=Pseudomonas fluorescens HK44 TaxID=1042209 RepID=A0A010RV20_PSEFL|nr:FliM/FliN family flagellar motor switch protein [Pseudomonas fluorescens]EXF96146.1 type III secretion apparatus protein SpaO [Pseudomonas fluorescens HK44]